MATLQSARAGDNVDHVCAVGDVDGYGCRGASVTFDLFCQPDEERERPRG